MALNTFFRVLYFRREYALFTKFFRLDIYLLRAVFQAQKTSFAVVCVDMNQKLTIIM